MRELENLLERLVVLTAGDTITRGDLAHAFKHLTNSGAELWRGQPLKETVAEFEYQVIQEAIEASPNLAAAAAALGVDVSTLTRKRQRYQKLMQRRPMQDRKVSANMHKR